MSTVQRFDWIKGSGVTVGAQKVLLCSTDEALVYPLNTVVVITGNWIGKTADGLTVASCDMKYRARQSAVNTLTVIGLLTAVLPMVAGSDLAVAGCTPYVETINNVIQGSVKGVLGYTLEWTCDLFIRAN